MVRTIPTNCDQPNCPKYRNCLMYNTLIYSKDNSCDQVDVLFIKNALNFKSFENENTNFAKKNPFCNKTGQFIISLINYIEEKELHCRIRKGFTNIIKSPKENYETWKYCSKILQRDIERLKPKLIVTIGSIATSYLLYGYYDKEILRVHKSYLTKIKIHNKEIPVLPIRDISRIVYDPSLIPDIAEDLRRALRVAPLSPMKSLQEREAPTKLNEVKELIKYLMHVKTEAIAFDTEDKNLNRKYGNTLDSIQFCYDSKKAYLVWVDHPQTPFYPVERKSIKKWLYALFSRNNPSFKYWIAHNAQFDLAILASLLKVKVAQPIICTMTFAFLLEENYMDSAIGDYSLKSLSKRYGFKDYDAEALAARSDGQLRDLSREKFINYATNDASATIQLYNILKRIAKGQGYYDKVMNLLRYFYSRVYKLLVNMEQTGIVLDIPKLKYLKSYESPINDRIREIINIEFKKSKAIRNTNNLLVNSFSITKALFCDTEDDMPWVFDIDKLDHRRLLYFHVLGLKPLQLPKINCLSCKGIGKIDIAGTPSVCPKCKGTTISTNFDTEGYTTIAGMRVKPGKMDKVFQDKYNNYPEVSLYKEYNKLKKLKTSYIESIEKYLNPKNGYKDYYTDMRIRPEIRVLAKTGRAKVKNPNSQQIPRGDTPVKKAIKNLFCAPPGYAIVSLDYMAIEVRSWGIISNDKTMAEMFNKAKNYRNLWRKTGDEKYLKLATTWGDIHVANASAMYDVPNERFLESQCSKCRKLKKSIENCIDCEKEKKILKEMRQASKALTFGSIFGRSLKSMAQGMNCDEETAANRRDKAFSKFKEASNWLDQIQVQAKKHLYVESPLGRRRRLWELLPRILNYQKFFLLDNSFTNRALRQAKNCFDYKTEILTENGWRKIYNLNIGDKVLTKNSETSLLEWQAIKKIHNYPDYEGELYNIKSKSFSTLCTPNHRWLIYNKTTKRNELREMSNISVHGDHKIHRTGIYKKESTAWTDDEVALIGWVVTDASYKKYPKWNLTTITINQSKEENKSIIDNIFNNLNIKFSKIDNKINITEKINTNWSFSGNLAIKIRNILPYRTLTPEFICSLSLKQLEILCTNMVLGNGWKDNKTGARRICAETEHEANMLQILFVLMGKSSSAKYYKPAKKEYKIKNTNVIIRPTKGIWIVREHKREKIHIYKKDIKREFKKEPVWCITVKNSTFIARREGQTYISGNSPIQGFASDITFLGASLMHEEFTVKQKRDWHFFNTVHDAVYLYVPISEVKECVLASESYFTDVLCNTLKKEFNFNVPFPLEAEYEIGIYGGDLIKWDFSESQLDQIVEKLKEIDEKRKKEEKIRRKKEKNKQSKIYNFKGF